MRIRLAVPKDLNRDETEAILNAALEAVTRADEALLARGRAPSFGKALQGGVRWRPEPPGDEHFDLASTVVRRGWGDCDDLAPHAAATLRANGSDPEARAIVRPSGPGRWHAVVELGSGKIYDPSKAAGMGSVGADEYRGPFWSPMYGDRLTLATSPLARGWGARVDVPMADLPFSYSALSRGVLPAHAVVGAIRGACRVAGDELDPEAQLRLGALHDLLVGAPPSVVREAVEQWGGDVGFFGALLPAAASLAAPVISKVLPGGGGGAAPGGGGGGGGWNPSTPGSTVSIPGGPIIVRF